MVVLEASKADRFETRFGAHLERTETVSPNFSTSLEAHKRTKWLKRIWGATHYRLLGHESFLGRTCSPLRCADASHCDGR
jgi:hypothetical protein